MSKSVFIRVLSLFSLIVVSSIACTLLGPISISQPTLPKVTGDEAEISKTNLYQDTFSNWVLHGLLTNTAAYAIADIEIEIEFFDSANTSVYKTTLTEARNGLPPGASLPFTLRVIEEIPEVDNYAIEILKLIGSNITPAQIDTTGISMRQYEDGILQITGLTINNGESPVNLLQIRAATFSEDGKIISAGNSNIHSNYLAARTTAPFEVFLDLPKDVVMPLEFEIYTIAESTSPIDTFDVEFLGDQHTYTDQFDWFHVVGELKNQSTAILDIHLLAVLFDADDNVIDVSSYDVPLSAIPPGESAPYDIRFAGPSMEIDPEQVDHWSVQVDPKITRVVDSPSYELTTSENQQEYSEGLGTFTGQVVNDSGTTLQAIVVVIGLRELNSGQLIGLGQTLILDEFPDGTSSGYSITIQLEPKINPSSLEYFIIARGR